VSQPIKAIQEDIYFTAHQTQIFIVTNGAAAMKSKRKSLCYQPKKGIYQKSKKGESKNRRSFPNPNQLHAQQKISQTKQQGFLKRKKTP
jgi:hypothetical protein